MNLPFPSLRFLAFTVVAGTTLAPGPALARLGESEAESEKRYGAPATALVTAEDKPLLEGIRDTAYQYQGWRIRAAFLEGKTARIEYARLPENGVKKAVTKAEAEAILDAEGGRKRWREPDKKSTGDAGKDITAAIAGAFLPKAWERPDRATAALSHGNAALLLEAPAAAAHEKKLKKAAQEPEKAVIPKF